MDGHTSHINLPVSEFCRDHGIILYCFPPHSSHVLQPLDVTVFGPLKKQWNKSIDDFKSEHKRAMTKLDFFPVFDKAWKNSTNPRNAISGFRKTGLIPFNADNVDFTKLIQEKSIAQWKESNKNQQTNENEKLGIARCFVHIENIIGEDTRKVFETRFSEGYDIPDPSNFGKLWEVYSGIRKLFNESKNSVGPGPPVDATNLDLSTSILNDSTVDMNLSNVLEFEVCYRIIGTTARSIPS